jgi:hypothetical protein
LHLAVLEIDHIYIFAESRVLAMTPELKPPRSLDMTPRLPAWRSPGVSVGSAAPAAVVDSVMAQTARLTGMAGNERAADGGTLNVVLLIAALAVLVGLRWLTLKAGYAL